MMAFYDNGARQYFIRRDAGDWMEVSEVTFKMAISEAGFDVRSASHGFAHFDLPGGHAIEGKVEIKPARSVPLYPPAPEEEY